MFEPYITVYTFFRLINAAIILAFFAYLFKKYWYQWAIDTIQSRSTFLFSLFERKTHLESRRRDLEADIKRQRRYTQHVHELVENWNEKVDGVLSRRAEEKKSINRTIEKYLDKRSQSLFKNAMIRKIVPTVLYEAQSDLENYFKDTDKGKAFVGDIIRYMKKKEGLR